MCKLSDFSCLLLTEERRKGLEKELDAWHKEYLPIKKGTILDIGAGCGETAFFYAMHGAKRVICIEADKENIKALWINAKTIFEKFGVEMDIVQAFVDSIKIDIEGSELGMVVEYHFPYRWQTIRRPNRYTSIARLRKRNLVHKLIGQAENLPVIEESDG